MAENKVIPEGLIGNPVFRMNTPCCARSYKVHTTLTIISFALVAVRVGNMEI